MSEPFLPTPSYDPRRDPDVIDAQGRTLNVGDRVDDDQTPGGVITDIYDDEAGVRVVVLYDNGDEETWPASQLPRQVGDVYATWLCDSVEKSTLPIPPSKGDAMPKWGHRLGGPDGTDRVLGLVVNEHPDGAVDAFLFPGFNAAAFGMTEGVQSYQHHIPASQWESAAEAKAAKR